MTGASSREAWGACRRTTEVTVLSASLALFGCGDAGTSQEPLLRQPIVGGNDTTGSEWLGVPWLEVGCSGVLIHPDVVVFAAHCGIEQEQFWFGNEPPPDAAPQSDGMPFSVAAESCQSARPETGLDVAYCVLEREVSEATPFRPLLGCEVPLLQVESEVDLVGWGTPATDGGELRKRHVVGRVQEVNEGLILAGDQTAGTCGGDSGGPALLKVASDPIWRFSGVLTQGLGACGLGRYVRAHTFIEWLETNSQIDVSPCFTGVGDWHETPYCTINDPARGHCERELLPTRVDFDPPKLTVDVQAEYVIDVDQVTARVSIVVEASDEGTGLRSAEAIVTASAAKDYIGLRSQDWFAPYELDLALPRGTHEIVVAVVDHSNNETTEAVSVRVATPHETSAPSGCSSVCQVTQARSRSIATSAPVWLTLLLLIRKRAVRKTD